MLFGWWAAVTVYGWWQLTSEESVQREFVAAVEPQLTTSRFPHVTDHESQTEPPSPLRVSAHAEYSEDVSLRATVALAGTETEVPASEVMDLFDLQCAYPAPDVEMSVLTAAYQSDEDTWSERTVNFECGADPGPLRQWLTWAEGNPADADLGDRSVDQGRYDGEDFPLKINAYLPDAADDTFRRAIDHFCAYPAIDELDVTLEDEDEDRTRSSIRLNSPFPGEGPQCD